MNKTTFTIKGRVASKKNSKRLVRAGNRIIPISSKAYEAFRESALWQLKTQKVTYPTGELWMEISFRLKGKFDADLDNMASSILDVLQDAQIIGNDSQVVHLELTKTPSWEDWETRITIAQIVDPVLH